MNATLYAVWDDDAGFVTVPTEDRASAEAALPAIQELWNRLDLTDADSRIRTIHLHLVGPDRYDTPGDNCGICDDQLTDLPTTYSRGDRVHLKDWPGVFVIDRFGYDAGGAPTAEVTSEDTGFTWVKPASVLTKVSV